MQRYFISLSYDGSRYHGWQVQPNGISVQQTLAEALSVIMRRPVEITGAGRTDAGVHARYMVAHFDVDDTVDCALCKDKLNRLLPPDINVFDVFPVNDDMHARFSAKSRRYEYVVTLIKNPFLRAYSYRLNRKPDFDLMNQAAAMLLDQTDFTSFSKLHTDVKTNFCKVTRAEWVQVDDTTWKFIIEADRFLRNMVRAVVGTLLDVGFGKIGLQDFASIIEKKDRCSAGMSVPASGLFLVDVKY